MGIQYRISQFWHTISIKKEQLKLEQALELLNPDQQALFSRMQLGEQDHAVIVFNRLFGQGENQPDLLVAALLHDVGKLRYRMHPLERAMVVLVRAGMPNLAHRWGVLPPSGWNDLPAWRKAFIVAEHHAGWGAEMARKAGVSPLTENLIRLHHHPYGQAVSVEETNLLHKLWLVDNES